MTHERLDDRTAREVVGGELDAAHDRQLAAIEGIVVFVEGAVVLTVRGSDLADGRDAERDQVAVGMRRVTLEVPVQASLQLRGCELVLGSGEVVHPDVHVSRFSKAPDGESENLELGFRQRQLLFADAALRLEEGGQVRVVVDRDPVRLHRDDHSPGCG